MNKYGANTLLGYAVELQGEEVENLTLDERITIASMGTEMGAIILLIPPSNELIKYSESKAGQTIEKVVADGDAEYAFVDELNIEDFVPMVSRPGKPHDSVDINEVKKVKIDSAFETNHIPARISSRILVAIRNRQSSSPV